MNSAINQVNSEPKSKLNKIESNSANYNPGSRILLDSTNLDSQAANNTSSFHNSQKQNFIKNDPGDKINGEVQNNMISNASNISQDLQPSANLPIFGVFIAPSLNKEKFPQTSQGVKVREKLL